MAIFDGIRVIDFGTGLAPSLATMLLADNGADVIKVEPPGGDPLRATPAWRMWNRGKRSVVLDIWSDEGRAGAVELMGSADVVLQNWRVGVAEANRVDYETVAGMFPRLVYATVTAMGPVGPYAPLPCEGAVVEARGGGCMDLSSWMERSQPSYRTRPNSSYATANLAAQGIASALLVRQADGLGQHVETSLYQGYLAYDFLGALRRQSELKLMDPVIPPAGTRLKAHPLLPYLAVRCRDGQWMQITNQTDRMFRRWMTVLDLDFIWDDARWSGARFVFPDQEAKEALAKLILERMATKTFDEWMTIFLVEGLTGDRFLTTQQALDNPQVRHNGSVVEVSDPELGPTLQLGMMASFSVSPGRVKGAAPGLDQHCGAYAPETGDVAGSAAEAAAGVVGAAAGAGRGPLAGLTVLEFASWLAGPYGTSLLADLGARVIKVESPSGDDGRWSLGGRSRTFQGKESLVIDLKRPEGQEVVAKLLSRADGLMHNMRGDAAARLGVDYESARRHNPEIVYLYAGSYGSSGPGAGRGAFHPTMGALSGGVLRQIGRGNEPPAADVELDGDELYAVSLALGHCNESSPDITGALGVATAMTMGFLHRARTGQGQYIESTMLASNLYLCSEDAIRYEGQVPLAELDGDIRGLGPLDRLYATGSGWLLVSCHTQAEWEGLCDVVGRPDLVGQERFADAAARRRFGDQLIAELSVALGARTADEWEGLCQAAGVAAVRADAMNGDDFFLTHPQVAENGFIVEVSHPGVGTYHRSNCGVRFSRTPGVANAAHLFGQDGAAILGELGYDDETVAQWVKAGVVVLPEEGSGP